jgi:hypothetical protein
MSAKTKIKFILIVSLLTLISCEKMEKEELQENTTIQFNLTENITLPDCIIGSYNDGKWLKVAEIDTIHANAMTDKIVIPDTIDNVWLFTSYFTGFWEIRKFNKEFKIKSFANNIILLDENIRGYAISKDSISQYPN